MDPLEEDQLDEELMMEEGRDEEEKAVPVEPQPSTSTDKWERQFLFAHPSEVAMDNMSSCCQSALVGPQGDRQGWQRQTFTQYFCEHRSLVGNCCPELLHLLRVRRSLGSSSSEEKERQWRMRKTMKTASCARYLSKCQSPLAEPWDEDAATSLTEGDGQEHCAGVRSDSERSVELRERRFSSVHLEKCAQSLQKLQFTSAFFACSGPRQEEHLPCLSSTGRLALHVSQG
ncbi:UNVERIFIED_CONTAM: hypothetical protein FKN15_014540 [Acipenser sinensis]